MVCIRSHLHGEGSVDATRVLFDDERWSRMRWLLPTVLVERLGIEGLVDRTLISATDARPTRPQGHSLVSAMRWAIASMTVRAALRQTRRARHACAPSTLACSARVDLWHARELDRTRRHTESARGGGCRSGEDLLVVMSIRSSVRSMLYKQAPLRTRTSAYHPIVAPAQRLARCAHPRSEGQRQCSRAAFVEELIPRVQRAAPAAEAAASHSVLNARSCPPAVSG